MNTTASTQTITVMLADDHAVVRSGFRRFLEEFSGIEVVAEAASGEQAYRGYFKARPDVLVLDIAMPDKSGLALLQRILAHAPDARIVLFSMYQEAAMAARAARMGARGYVTKSSAPEILLKAVREVAAGRCFFSPDVAQAMTPAQIDGSADPLLDLSAREFDVFRQLVAGRTQAQIAGALDLSVKTVANHHTQIKQKLRAANDIELIRIALREKLIAE